MSREQELHEDIGRSKDAQQLLENPLLQDAFESIRTTLHKQWAESPAADSTGREKLWLMLALLKMVKHHIEAHISTGEESAIILKDEKARRKIFNII